jgi:hypothetical protein
MTIVISAAVATLIFAYSAPTRAASAPIPSSTSSEGVYIILAAGGPEGNSNDAGSNDAGKDAKKVVVDPQDLQQTKAGVFPGFTVQGAQGHVNSQTGDYPTPTTGDTAATAANAPPPKVPVRIHPRK